jgi:hypothetical protein
MELAPQLLDFAAIRRTFRHPEMHRGDQVACPGRSAYFSFSERKSALRFPADPASRRQLHFHSDHCCGGKAGLYKQRNQ